MSPEARQKLRQMLLRDEKYSQYPYVDTTGHLTIAIGQNISPTGDGISLSSALFILDEQISSLYDKMCHFFPWFMALNDARQSVLVAMTFNLGFPGFLKFHDMIRALENGDIDEVVKEMINSKWDTQLPERVTRYANIMKTGEI
jgi:lysozyme